jgi:hypothetical protein
MKLSKYQYVALLLVSVIIGSATAAFSSERGPIADFALGTLDGTTIRSGDVPLSGHWLVIYVQPQSGKTESLLRALSVEQYPGLASKTAIIVGGTTDQAKELIKKFPDLAQAIWYTDNSKEAYSKLKLRGSPIIIGMNERDIQWAVSGMLPDANTFKSVLMSWIKG